MFKSSSLFLVALLLAACVALSSQQSWNVTSPNLTSTLLGVSFNSTTTGYVCGAGILKTVDGAQKWRASGPSTIEDAIYFDVETYPNYNYAFATGLVIAQRPAAVYTIDGSSWFESSTILEEGAFQGAQALTPSDLFLFGTWAIFKQGAGNGFGYSTNGGSTFNWVDWPSDTQARYGSFVSPTTGWISGGQWPDTEDSVSSETVHSLSRHVHLRKGNKLFYNPRPVTAANSNKTAPFNGWRAVICSTTDLGKTWNTLFNYSSTDPDNGFYMNAIWFVNATLGFIAGEGNVGGYPVAFVNRTTNGGRTWTTVLTIPDGSLMQLKFLNANYGWAVGGVGASFGATQQFWQTTNGGNSWTSYSVKYDYATNVNIVNTQLSHATMVTPFQTSSVASFS